MKKLILLFLSLQFILISCEKEHEREFPCPVVMADQVPSIVKESFGLKYPKITIDNWYNKDNTGYYASFQLNNIKTLASFKNDGTFIAEKAQVQTGQHNEHENDCGCEVN